MAERTVDIRSLVLRAGDQVLLDEADLAVEDGELCVLVGASGTGKSLTLSILSGLLRRGGGVTAQAESARVLGQDALARRGGAGIEGASIVFQDFALLDDTSATGNVRFGIDHRRTDRPGSGDEARAEAHALLDELGLPKRKLPSEMSGGMKQRLAIARALAFRPRLMLYDEPTSGLDPATSRRVAKLIRDGHDNHGGTTVVVTHDLEALSSIADRILILDPSAKRFREIARDKQEIEDALHTMQNVEVLEREPPGTPLAHRLAAPLVSAGDFVLGSLSTIRHLLPDAWVNQHLSARWAGRFFWRFLRLGTLGTAMPFLLLAGAICGFVTTFFTYALLPYQGYTEPVLTEEFIGSLGFALYRVVVPGIVTILFATRSGAAIAADVGNRVLTRQVDALKAHGVPPACYLLWSLSWSSLLGIPLLFWIAWAAARIAALAVFLGTHPGHGPYAFDQDFTRMLDVEGWLGVPEGNWWVLGKLLVSALGTAGIAYHVGMRPKRSGAEVASGVTTTIIGTTVFVLIVHLLFALWEF